MTKPMTTIRMVYTVRMAFSVCMASGLRAVFRPVVPGTASRERGRRGPRSGPAGRPRYAVRRRKSWPEM